MTTEKQTSEASSVERAGSDQGSMPAGCDESVRMQAGTRAVRRLRDAAILGVAVEIERAEVRPLLAVIDAAAEEAETRRLMLEALRESWAALGGAACFCRGGFVCSRCKACDLATRAIRKAEGSR